MLKTGLILLVPLCFLLGEMAAEMAAESYFSDFSDPVMTAPAGHRTSDDYSTFSDAVEEGEERVEENLKVRYPSAVGKNSIDISIVPVRLLLCPETASVSLSPVISRLLLRAPPELS